MNWKPNPSGTMQALPDPVVWSPQMLELRRVAPRRAAVMEARILRAAFRQPPRLTGTEWADRYRYLSPEASAEPGKYESSRAPYQREPLNAMCDPLIRKVVLMWPSQIGKTECICSAIGKRIHQHPGPMLVLQPTLEMAESWSKDRLAPMLRDTPVLRGLVKDPRSRDSGNTLLHKQFPSGHLTAVGANSPAGLASRPIRDLWADEIDRYPLSAGSEGDPLGLASRRTATFGNSKKVFISSPTIKGASRIEAEFLDSDQRRWQVPCPHCNEYQELTWGGPSVSYGLKWDAGKPETAYYVCRSGCVIDEMHKGAMNAKGRWVAQNPGHATAGFWTNALISPFDGSRWGKLAAEFLEVKRDPIRLRSFVNTVLCETWEDEGVRVDAHALMDRLEDYPTDEEDQVLAPKAVAVVTAAVDVQDDRLEVAWYGWRAGEEGWLLRTEIIAGDPGTQAPWDVVDAMLLEPIRHERGTPLPVAVTFVDSGGHHTKAVYAFTRPRAARRIFAIKGSSLEGAPLLGRPSRNNAARAILYMVGSFTGKESVMARLSKISDHGPGYLHLPAWLDAEQLQQITNEKLVTKIIGGRAKRLWLKTGRNEQLDMLVYALAALQVVGAKALARITAAHDALSGPDGSESEPKPTHAAPIVPPSTPPRRGGFVNSWRK